MHAVDEEACPLELYREAALAEDDDMMADRLEEECKGLSEEIKAWEGEAAKLRARLAARDHTKQITRRVTDYCRRMRDAFEAVSIPFEKKREMLTALRVIVLDHSDGTLKLQTNIGAVLAICPEIRS